jgi:hypothetical protein
MSQPLTWSPTIFVWPENKRSQRYSEEKKGTSARLEQARVLKETERAEILSRYVRQMLRTQWNRTGAGQSLVRINTIGFFYESPDVGAFLWALARENDGGFVGMSKP